MENFATLQQKFPFILNITSMGKLHITFKEISCFVYSEINHGSNIKQ